MIRKIYWTGQGSKLTGIHSCSEFMKLIQREMPEYLYWRRRGDKEVPFGLLRRNDLNGWMRLGNAHFIIK